MTIEDERPPLSRERVVAAAIELADEIGMEALTIRKLAAHLDVGPMTIYHYLASKEQIIDGMIDSIFSEIEEPSPDDDWRTAVRQRCISMREVLNRHRWAPAYMESRTAPGPANLRHHDAVIGSLRGGELSLQLTAHAYAILDAFVYGFTLQEATLPSGGGEGFAEVAEDIAAAFDAEAYPHLVELTVGHVLQPGYDFADSFEFGLDLILDGLARASREDPSAG